MIKILLATVLSGSVSTEVVNHEKGMVGVRLGVFNHVIKRVYPNTPADIAGFQPGDKVVYVIDDAGRHEITGEPGTFVTITVERDRCHQGQVCKEKFTYEVVRAPESTINRN